MGKTAFSGPLAVGTFSATQSFPFPGTPGGWTGAFIRYTHAAFEGTAGTALTGDATGLRVRVENDVASMTGKVRAIQAQATNDAASASGTVQALDIESLAKGNNLGTLRGSEIVADNSEGTGTITTMVGLRVGVVGAGTVTNGPWGIQIINRSEDAQASAQPLDAFIRCESAVTTTVCGGVIDVTDARINNSTGQYSITLTADDNVLFYYKDKDGTAHAVVASDADALAIRS